MLEKAGMTKDDLTRVVLAGGSLYIPHIEDGITEYFGMDLVQKLEKPQEIVAQGAAFLALIIGNPNDPSIPKINQFNFIGAEFAEEECKE